MIVENEERSITALIIGKSCTWFQFHFNERTSARYEVKDCDMVSFLVPIPLCSLYHTRFSIDSDGEITPVYRHLEGMEWHIMHHYKFHTNISPCGYPPSRWIFINGFAVPYEEFAGSMEAHFSRPLEELLSIQVKG